MLVKSDEAEIPSRWRGAKGLTCSLVFAIFAAVLGMVQFGYNTAVINAPQKVIQEFISAVHLSRTGNMISEDTRDLIWSIAVSIFAIGGMVGGITGGTIATKFGRKGGLLLNNILGIAGAALMTFSKACGSFEMLILGRLAIGFNCGSNASVACKNLCAVFRKDIVNVHTCQRWFSKFRSGKLSLQESDRSGRPSKINNDVLRSMLENNLHLTSQEIAKEFGIHHTTVGDHIKYLGFVLKRIVWVPHELTEKNLSDRVRMCSSHLIRHNVELFLDMLITGDEKWILYENIKSKKSCCKPGTSSATVLKQSIHQRKVLLCLWWDRKGPVYYELLKQGETINADLYCKQLDKLNAAIKEKGQH
ncbi:histone-lysine N-methyltransferase SETMAR [Trichonephila clavipes]|nr:histone-lysine N-methyltransferase SETMAR [Trichonephila clavipes]